MGLRLLLGTVLLCCAGCAVGVSSVAPSTTTGDAQASRVAQSVNASVVGAPIHGAGIAKSLHQHAVAHPRAAFLLGSKPTVAHVRSKGVGAYAQRARSSAWTYVVSDGKIRAFDARGHLKSTPGGFPNLLLPIDIAYSPHNKLLYVLDVVTQKVHAYDLAGREHAFPGGFAGLTAGMALAYDAGRDVLCVDQEGEHMQSSPRCFDAGGKAHVAPATMPAKPSTSGASKTFAGVERIDALVLVTP